MTESSNLLFSQIFCFYLFILIQNIIIHIYKPKQSDTWLEALDFSMNYVTGSSCCLLIQDYCIQGKLPAHAKEALFLNE